jgi:hypothetical protein
MYTGIFPDCLKISVVKPLYKKGDKTSVTNSWPISLFPVFCKVLQMVMYSRVSHHMHSNNIFVPEQFDFRQGISTLNAAFLLTGSIFKSANQKMLGGIFCDLAEAFDYVNHKILLAELHFYGIQGTVSNWFTSYLTDREQKTEKM